MRKLCAVLLGLGLLLSVPALPGAARAAGAPATGGETRAAAWAGTQVDYSGSVNDFRQNLMRAMDTGKEARDEANVLIHAIYFMRARADGVAEPFRNGRPEADFTELFGWFQDIAQKTREFSPRTVARIYLTLKADYPRFYNEFERGWRSAVIAAGNTVHKESALSERLENMKKMSEDLME